MRSQIRTTRSNTHVKASAKGVLKAESASRGERESGAIGRVLAACVATSAVRFLGGMTCESE